MFIPKTPSTFDLSLHGVPDGSASHKRAFWVLLIAAIASPATWAQAPPQEGERLGIDILALAAQAGMSGTVIKTFSVNIDINL